MRGLAINRFGGSGVRKTAEGALRKGAGTVLHRVRDDVRERLPDPAPVPVPRQVTDCVEAELPGGMNEPDLLDRGAVVETRGEHDVLVERRLNLRLQLHDGKLQQADGLLKLRGHGQLLAESELQGGLEHSSRLWNFNLADAPASGRGPANVAARRLVVPGGSHCSTKVTTMPVALVAMLRDPMVTPALDRSRGADHVEPSVV